MCRDDGSDLGIQPIRHQPVRRGISRNNARDLARETVRDHPPDAGMSRDEPETNGQANRTIRGRARSPGMIALLLPN
jgi:hypothetical protein